MLVIAHITPLTTTNAVSIAQARVSFFSSLPPLSQLSIFLGLAKESIELDCAFLTSPRLLQPWII